MSSRFADIVSDPSQPWSYWYWLLPRKNRLTKEIKEAKEKRNWPSTGTDKIDKVRAVQMWSRVPT